MNIKLTIYTFLKFIQFIAWELLITTILFLTLTIYFYNGENTIKSDGEGYYDYLPSIFIHHDFIRLNTDQNSHPKKYNRIASKKDIYIDYHDKKVNKYPCGTSILLAPFYGIAARISHNTEHNSDGYTSIFHIWVFYAALFYLFITLLFLKKLLLLYDIDKLTIFLSQIFIIFSTSILEYSNQEASFSHIYSLFAITAFFFFCKKYFLSYRSNYFYWACLFLGLIILLRQVNIIIIFFIPFLAGSPKNLKTGIEEVFKRTSMLLKGLLLVLGLISIQCIAWHLQTGHLFLYSYQNEGFNFSNPELLNILFSYKKGLFVYAPILGISLLGLVKLCLNKQYYLAGTWLLFFSVCTYVLSSWWSWYYGCSYGLRAYIDFYIVFFILFALLLNHLRLWLKIPLLAICFLTIPINLIQTYQYQCYILHWIDMDQEKYWKVFLETDDKFRGIVWKKKYDYANHETLEVIDLYNEHLIPNQEKTLLQISSNRIKNQNLCTIIQLSFYNSFEKKNNTSFTLEIKNEYSHTTHLIQYAEEEFGTYHKGLYDFNINGLNPNQIISLVVSNKEDTVSLKDIKLVFLKQK